MSLRRILRTLVIFTAGSFLAAPMAASDATQPPASLSAGDDLGNAVFLELPSAGEKTFPPAEPRAEATFDEAMVEWLDRWGLSEADPNRQP